jgi:DNA replication protein DnaC
MKTNHWQRWADFCATFGVPRKMLHADHKNFKIISDVHGRSYLTLAEEWIKKPCSLLLEGDPGRGKTFFMHALVKGLLEKAEVHQICLMRSKDIDDRILAEFMQYGYSTNFLKRLADVEYLLIDDFGVQRLTERSERDWYDFVDRRIMDERVTVFSTNLDKKQFVDAFGGRIASRLEECKRIVFAGPDLRKRD